MDVADYLLRIGHRAPVRRDLETLTAIHRAHLSAIPYENLDIHLGRAVPLGAKAAFEKIVMRRRGGWCYEMNELLIWALGELGFDVYRAGAGVHREIAGDDRLGNHLIGIVRLDRPYLVDVGFGDGPLDPIPLAAGRYAHGTFEIGLERAGDWWRFRNHARGSAPSFDFSEEPRALDWFKDKCTELQTAPTSGFVRAGVLQRRLADRIYVVRGLIASDIRASGVTAQTIETRADYAQALRDWFGLDIGDDLLRLWPNIEARHRAWLAEDVAHGSTGSP
jgi:arylamine N-acetyltransferase